MKFPTINLLIYFIAYVFVNCVANENKTCEETRRIMGYVYQLDKPLSDFEAADFDDLKNAVYRHGVIVVRNVDLSAEEQMKITESIGYPLSSKNSKMLNIRPNRWLHDTVDGIFLAGNIDNTGFYEDVAQRSEYWHHDCNFMPQNRNWVFNILHTRVMPESGGDTGFIDTVVEDEDLADIFKNSKITVALGNISDYEGTEQAFSVTHDVIQKHPFTGKHFAYMPRGVLEHNGQKYFDSIKEVFGQYIDARPLYVHVWQEGDLLIWDNLSVMHRSMGGYKGRRLLHRTQAFYCSLD